MADATANGHAELILPGWVELSKLRSNSDDANVARAAASMVVNDPRMYGQRRVQAPDPFSEVGTSGLRQYGGFVLEEWLATLSGRRAAWVWREMMDNSAVVGGILFAIEMLARQVEWSVEGDEADKMPSGEKCTEYAESCMHDMAHTWGDTLSEILSFMPYGWSLHEEVFKRRNGEVPVPPIPGSLASEAPAPTEEDDSPPSSEYDDGLIGWRKLAGRAQETLMRWEFAGYATVRAMEQIDWHGGRHLIPIQKSMLFRTKATRNNPEGRSILRSAYESWYYMRNIQTIEAIGIERDAAGLPVATPPEGVDLWLENQADMLTKAQEMVASIRKDENQGIVKPTAGWLIELLRSGGTRQIDTNEVLKRYRQELAASMLADFFLVGMDGLGSYAMVDVKADLFGMAVDASLDMICDVFNRYGFPRLMSINGVKPKEKLRLKHTSAGRINLEQTGKFLQELSLAGVELPLGKTALTQMFNAAGLPAEFEGESVVTQDVNVGGPVAMRPGQTTQAQVGQQSKELPRPPSKVPRLRTTKADEDGQSPKGLIEVGPELLNRVAILTRQLEGEVLSIFNLLGQEAASAYIREPIIKDERSRRMLANRIFRALKLGAWVRDRLKGVLRNHAARTAGDTQRVLRGVGIDAVIGPRDMKRIEGEAGRHLRTKDIEPAVREAIMRAIEDGWRARENPDVTARRIREYVPAGVFTKAGPQYRARLIARTESGHLQRMSTLAMYRSSPYIENVRVRDGVFGPPRSDAECIDRSGEVVPVDEAEKLAPELHPMCTVSYDPIVEPTAHLAT